MSEKSKTLSTEITDLAAFAMASEEQLQLVDGGMRPEGPGPGNPSIPKPVEDPDYRQFVNWLRGW